MSDPAKTEVLGSVGEPCRSCGAPLAADQRYCLNCGARRGGPRIDFREHLGPTANVAAGAEGQAPPATANGTPPDQRPQRDYAPLAAVGGIAVLGLMLLVGVLIGKGDNGGDQAPAPVVVRGAEAEKGGESEATAGSADGQEKAERKTAENKARKAGDASSLTAGKNGGGPVEASDNALQELQESPDYSKESAKLPDEIATGGAPPPEDNKAPGGGSKGTAVE